MILWLMALFFVQIKSNIFLSILGLLYEIVE